MPPKKVEKKTVKKVAKKQAKKKELFEASKTRTSKIPYGGKQVYYNWVEAKGNAKYDDMKKYITNLRKEMIKQFPNALMNVSIKYSSVGRPISAGFHRIDEELKLKAPYDYHTEEDYIEGFYIQFTRD